MTLMLVAAALVVVAVAILVRQPASGSSDYRPRDARRSDGDDRRPLRRPRPVRDALARRLTTHTERLRESRRIRKQQYDDAARAAADAGGPDPCGETVFGETARDGTVSGHLALALDTWRGRDFTLRARAVGLSWLPFVEPPEHVETAEIADMRLRRRYRPDSEEQAALRLMQADENGRLAVLAAVVAARLHQNPAWHDDLLDRYQARIDLDAEVRTVAESAAAIRRARRILGSQPLGPRASDPEIVNAYIDKSSGLDQRADALTDRVLAFLTYAEGADRAREQLDRRAWLDATGPIDDFESRVDAAFDRSVADHLRQRAADVTAFAASDLGASEAERLIWRSPRSDGDPGLQMSPPYR
ncbi:hypothetical protein ACE11G_09610 [Gordonia sp. PS3]|uniref:Uncharacterized protein n=1 Tax=Gordonia sihwensis NBRC 108236 TaxID=1223544 RepID=L7LLL9_9ACTN|nr:MULTISPECIES: hypothetical protein [Gordonia]AUH69143.1 hypothetical protein CXX93_13360 [Gordonia sp. YC-JH1]GAC60967.1 hypothetical protein GSI01S_13_01500 [Gordonia sihwensis NBRC 108236]